MKNSVGEFELETPGDRNGSYKPQFVKKHQTHMSEQKILSLYALGNGYSQISEHAQELYGLEFSKATISAITDKVISLLKDWQQRPLESIYPFVWLVAIHYKIKVALCEKSYLCYPWSCTNGKKEILGLYLLENEVVNFWL